MAIDLEDIKEVRKIKTKEVNDVKKALIKRQGFKCPLCGGSLDALDLSSVALDHCHDTGYVRGVLHMGCNRVDGIVKKAILQWGRTQGRHSQVIYLENLSKYLRGCINDPIKLIYHRHKTPEETVALKKKRSLLAARKRRLSK